MTIARYYHTGLRGYVTADIRDVGAKPEPEPPATGDELLQPERLPRMPPPQVRKAPGVNQVIVLDACREAPGTMAELAERTGLSRVQVRQALSPRLFVEVERKVMHGRRRIVWGVK